MRLTQYSRGGGCACKVPASELERVLAGLPTQPLTGREVVGFATGDDAAAVRLDDGRVALLTTDFFTPVVDDPFDFGRIAAANALSDIYAMGGEPILAVNILAWPRDLIPFEIAAEVMAGGISVASAAGCFLAGGHSIDDAEPKYGLAVTGLAREDELLRNDRAEPGLPLTLTKPIGSGILNNRHKTTGETFPEAVEVMATLNRDAARAARAAGHRAATDVTGFGLLGHLHKMMRASGTTAVIASSAVPVLDGARESLAAGYVPGGSRNNLEFVGASLSTMVDSEIALLLADAQTSGGLLVVGELPGHPVIGEVVARDGSTTVVVR